MSDFLDVTLKLLALLGVAAAVISRIARGREIYLMYREPFSSVGERRALARFIMTRLLLGWDGTTQEQRIIDTFEALEHTHDFQMVPARQVYRNLLVLWMAIGRHDKEYSYNDLFRMSRRLELFDSPQGKAPLLCRLGRHNNHRFIDFPEGTSIVSCVRCHNGRTWPTEYAESLPKHSAYAVYHLTENGSYQPVPPEKEKQGATSQAPPLEV